MTGLDRLRGYARRMDELHVWPGGAKLLDIAGQIEREHDAEVAGSPYEALPPDDREAIAWVRSHGGLDAVRSEWRSRVPYDRHEQRRQRLLDHIAECETALRRRNGRIEELGHRVGDLTTENAELRKRAENAELRKRAMPEGCEWPRYEDEAPVRIGHDGVRVVELFEDEYRLWGEGEPVSEEPIATGLYGERVKRPAPKVLDADGAEIEVGDDLYSVEGGLKLHVGCIDTRNGKIATDAMFALDKWADPKMYTHRAPVLAADGKPLREGETVLVTMDEPHDAPLSRGDEVTVRFVPQSTIVHVEDEEGFVWYVGPNDLTHERPVNHCFECSHWQAEPGRDMLGVCWDTYGERECEDSYAAVLGTSEACAQFERRAKALAERDA